MQTAIATRTRICAEVTARFVCLIAGGVVGGLIASFLASAIAGGCLGITIAIGGGAIHRAISLALVFGLWFSFTSIPIGWLGGVISALCVALLPTNPLRMLLTALCGVTVLVGCMLIAVIVAFFPGSPFTEPIYTPGLAARTLFYAGTGALWPLTRYGRRFAHWAMPARGHFAWVYISLTARPHRSNS
jgi:hypothetical protein